MANIIEDNGLGIPKNRKREYRGTIIAGNADVVFFLLDPSKNTKIQVVKDSENAEIQASSDSKLANGTQITTVNVIDTSIVFTIVSSNNTADFYASDKGLTILRLESSGSPGANDIQYNVTQDGD